MGDIYVIIHICRGSHKWTMKQYNNWCDRTEKNAKLTKRILDLNSSIAELKNSIVSADDSIEFPTNSVIDWLTSALSADLCLSLHSYPAYNPDIVLISPRIASFVQVLFTQSNRWCRTQNHKNSYFDVAYALKPLNCRRVLNSLQCVQPMPKVQSITKWRHHNCSARTINSQFVTKHSSDIFFITLIARTQHENIRSIPSSHLSISTNLNPIVRADAKPFSISNYHTHSVEMKSNIRAPHKIQSLPYDWPPTFMRPQVVVFLSLSLSFSFALNFFCSNIIKSIIIMKVFWFNGCECMWL